MTETRGLTNGEVALCRSVFGNSIDYPRVRLHRRRWWPLQPRNVVMAPNGHIYFHPGSPLWSEDFASRPIDRQGLLIHEMTHVWQAQTKGRFYLILMRHPFCRYRYRLIQGRRFERYGIEQQAEIVRHVFLMRQGMRLGGVPLLRDLERALPFQCRGGSALGGLRTFHSVTDQRRRRSETDWTGNCRREDLMTRRMILAAVAALIVVGGWYWGSPWWTLWRMQEAARANDADRFAAYVDYRALAAQAKAENQASWGSVLVSVRSDTPGGRRFIALAKRRLATPDKDLAVRFDDIRPWLAKVSVGFGGLSAWTGVGYRPYIVHRGLDEFEARDRLSPEHGGTLTFHRHGLGWRLVGVRYGQQ